MYRVSGHVQRKTMGGFSLIELMVTLIIVAILMAVAVPGMTDLYRDARLSTQTDALVSLLNSARLEAVKQRKAMTVCPLAAPATDTACSNSTSDWTKGFGIHDGTSIIQRVSANRDATVTTTATSVVFVATFGSTAAAACFALNATGRKQQRVNVGVSGRVSKKVDATNCS